MLVGKVNLVLEAEEVEAALCRQEREVRELRGPICNGPTVRNLPLENALPLRVRREHIQIAPNLLREAGMLLEPRLPITEQTSGRKVVVVLRQEHPTE